MNKTKLLSLGTFALTTALSLAPLAHADHWNNMNDPNGFNVVWHPTHYNTNLDALPTVGGVPTAQTPWGDSYWPKNRGAFSYRWNDFQQKVIAGEANQDLTDADRKRLFFSSKAPSKQELLSMSREELAKLSPLEKYSIVAGDFGYKLVNEYRNKNSPDDAYWEGYCHAWSAAAAHYTEPKPVDIDVTITDGHKTLGTITVPFGTGDVKALLTANYADLDGWSNATKKLNKFKHAFNKNAAPPVEIRYVGNMCKQTFIYPVTKIKKGVEVLTDYSDTDGKMDTELESLVEKYQSDVIRLFGSKDPKTLTQDQLKRLNDARNPFLASNARQSSKDPACSDTNAGAFHIVMANQLGIMKEGFLMDKTRDAEVWNQPVYKFDSEIKGYEIPSGNASPGTVKMANVVSNLYYADDTDYGWTFWNPSLSGIFNLKAYFTSFMDEYNKYQDMLISEGDLDARKEYPEHVLAHAHYEYKLELDRDNKIIGGQWLTLDRPDDLYFVKKVGFVGSFDQLGKIYQPIEVNTVE